MFFLTILTILSSYILYKTIQGVFFILCDNMVSLDGSISINLNQSIYLSIYLSRNPMDFCLPIVNNSFFSVYIVLLIAEFTLNFSANTWMSDVSLTGRHTLLR